MSFVTEKAALINILKEKECTATKDVYNNLAAYSDIPRFFFKFTKAFDGDNAYLDTLAAVWDDASLQAVGVYYNKTGVTLTNPKVVIKCTNITINVGIGGDYGDLEIVGASQVNFLNIYNGTNVESLAVSGGSIVAVITIDPDSSVDTLLVKSENGQNSEVTKVIGTNVKNAAASPDSVFGGYECEYIPPP